MNTVEILKKNIIKHIQIDDFDMLWDLIYKNYDKLFQSSSKAGRSWQQNIGIPFIGDADTQHVKTILIFASSIREVELKGSLEDINDIKKVIETQAKRFQAEKNEYIQILDSFKKEMMELIAKNKLVDSSRINNSGYHSPYQITILQNKSKKGGTLVVHVGEDNNYIDLTDIQLKLLLSLAKKCMDDKALPPLKRGWLTYQEIKDQVDVWDMNITSNDLVRNQISLIRKKLKTLHLSELLIENADGIGYRLGTFPDNITLV